MKTKGEECCVYMYKCVCVCVSIFADIGVRVWLFPPSYYVRMGVDVARYVMGNN